MDDNYQKIVNIGLERNVLAALMTFRDALDLLPVGFNVFDFSSLKHHEIYHAIQALNKTESPYGFALVRDWLKLRDKLSLIGGEEYLLQLSKNTVASSDNTPVYARQIMDLAAKRRGVQALDMARAELFDNPDKSAAEIIGGAVMEVLEAFDTSVDEGPIDIKTSMLNFMSRLDEPKDRLGIKTGILGLDNLIPSGLTPGQLIVIAAGTGMGKTTLAMNILDGMMKNSQKSGLVFSMEMRESEIIDRFMSSVSDVQLTAIRSGKITNDQKYELSNTALRIKATRKLWIDHRERRKPEDVQLTARMVQRKGGKLCAIVIDYVQLMRLDNFKGIREQEVAEISRSLKALAIQMECPVIALAQLNRDERQGAKKRPGINNIRESGQIANDADIVMFIHRDEIGTKKSEIDDQPFDDSTDLIIAKHRNGPLATVKLEFQAKFSRYVDYIPPYARGGFDDE